MKNEETTSDAFQWDLLRKSLEGYEKLLNKNHDTEDEWQQLRDKCQSLQEQVLLLQSEKEKLLKRLEEQDRQLIDLLSLKVKPFEVTKCCVVSLSSLCFCGERSKLVFLLQEPAPSQSFGHVLQHELKLSKTIPACICPNPRAEQQLLI